MIFRYGLVAWLFLLLFANVGLASSVHKSHVEAELISNAQEIAPGKPFWIGLRMKMDEGWHTYWRNSGDSGLSTHIEWQLPEGFGAGDIQWPYPARFDYASGLTGYGYEGEVVLLTEIWPPEDFERLEDTMIYAQVRWLSCKEICVPGSALLSINFPASKGEMLPPEIITQAIDGARQRWPVQPEEWSLSAMEKGDNYLLRIKPKGHKRPIVSGLSFFPLRNDIINHSADQKLTIIRDGYQLTVPKAVLISEAIERIQGVLIAVDGWDAEKKSKALFFDAAVQ